MDVKTDAYIPSGYIANEFQKLDIYKRIAGIETNDEAEEMVEELIDRFGEPPNSVQNLIVIANLKAKAHRLFIREVIQRGADIKLVMHERARIHAERIPTLIKEAAPALRFTADAANPFFTYQIKAGPRGKNTDVLEALGQLLDRMEILIGEENGCQL